MEIASNESAPASAMELPSGPRPPYRLHSPQAVMMASFLGSPAAGISLMSLNYFRLSRPIAGVAAIFAAILADAILAAAIYALPQGAWLVLWIAAMIPMFYFARILQGHAVEQHQIDGGEMAAPAASVSVGVLGLIIVAGSAFGAWKYNAPVWGTAVTFDHNTVYYSGQVTKEEGQNFAYALYNIHFFVKKGDQRVVLISRDSHGAVIRFITNIAWKDDPRTLQNYVNITQRVSAAIGGRPITVKMVDDNLVPMRSYLIK